MAEKTLVTQEDLANGAFLLQQLDQIDFQVTAAFWAYDPVLETWRLIIAAPQQAIDSLVTAYGTIQRVINDNYLGISLDRISLIPDGDAKLANLRALAESDSDDVVEASVGRTEIAGRVLEDIHLYRGSALRYERDVFQALQRLQPPNVVMRTNVVLPPGQEIDALLDDGEHPIIVEVKMRSRPVSINDVFELQGRLFSCSRFFGREVAAILVSRSGFTARALEAAESTRVTLVKWAGQEDDEQIERALAKARGELHISSRRATKAWRAATGRPDRAARPSRVRRTRRGLRRRLDQIRLNSATVPTRHAGLGLALSRSLRVECRRFLANLFSLLRKPFEAGRDILKCAD